MNTTIFELNELAQECYKSLINDDKLGMIDMMCSNVRDEHNSCLIVSNIFKDFWNKKMIRVTAELLAVVDIKVDGTRIVGDLIFEKKIRKEWIIWFKCSVSRTKGGLEIYFLKPGKMGV